MAATLAALAVASAYGSGPVLILTALPMLVIASSYRRLNLWSANCGASYILTALAGVVAAGVIVMGYAGSSCDPRSSRAGRHVVTCLLCQMTDPSPDNPCLPGWDHRVSPLEAGCPGCGRLEAACTGWRACSARRSMFRWRLAWLRVRRAWRQLRPRPPDPSCCGSPGRCSR
jgi:hypothetical protein